MTNHYQVTIAAARVRGYRNKSGPGPIRKAARVKNPSGFSAAHGHPARGGPKKERDGLGPLIVPRTGENVKPAGQNARPVRSRPHYLHRKALQTVRQREALTEAGQ